MLKDTVSRNNIFHIWKSHWNAIYNVETGNDLDYDMTNGGDWACSGAEPNRVIGTPIYAAGHGWQSEAGGYQLAPNSPGFDKGTHPELQRRLPAPLLTWAPTKQASRPCSSA